MVLSGGGNQGCRLEPVLTSSQTWPTVEESEQRHEEGGGVGGIAGQLHFPVAPAKKWGKMQCVWLRRLSVGGRTTRRSNSGSGFLSRWSERLRDSSLGIDTEEF